MITRVMAALAGVGMVCLVGSAAFADGEGYDLRQGIATDLQQQFDAVAPQHKDSAGYVKAMALAKKAEHNIAWENYTRASFELRGALHDIHVYPNQ